MILVDRDFRAIPGYVYGSTQKSILGHIHIRAIAPNYLDQLNLLLRDYFSSSLLKRYEDSPITSQSELLECFLHLIVQLQRSHSIPTSTPGRASIICKMSEVGGLATFLVCMPYSNKAGLELTMKWVLALFNSAAKNTLIDDELVVLTKEFHALGFNLNRMGDVGQNYPSLIDAAQELKIPVLRDEPDWIRVGIGSKSIDLFSSITMHTSPIGIQLVKNKLRAGKILRSAGMPSPFGLIAKNAQQACEIAQRIGYPVVVKPVDQEGGRGVFANVISDEIVKTAFQNASQHSNRVMVEKHFDGIGHRLLVFRGEVVKVTKKLPWGVVGDGINSIAELVRLANELKLKQKVDGAKFWHAFPLPMLDEEAEGLMSQYGLTPDSILEKDEFFALRRKNNAVSGGSTQTLSLQDVHPDNISLSIRVAALFGLDICGVDLITPDLAQTWLKGGAIICDINAQPQSDPQTIQNILSSLIKGEGRVPLHLILTSDMMLPQIQSELPSMANSLGVNGFSSKRGVWMNSQQVASDVPSGFQAARMMMLDRHLHSGLSLMSLDEVSKFGLPIDQYDSIRIVNSQAGIHNESIVLGANGNTKILKETVEMLIPHSLSPLRFS